MQKALAEAQLAFVTFIDLMDQLDMIRALNYSNNKLSTLEVHGALEILNCLNNPLGLTEGNEIVRAVGDGYVGVYLDTDDEVYYAVATPVDPLINWTEGGTEVSQNVKIDRVP